MKVELRILRPRDAAPSETNANECVHNIKIIFPGGGAAAPFPNNFGGLSNSLLSVDGGGRNARGTW